MKSKKFGFATIAIIILLTIPFLAFGGSEDYLVPVKIRKADQTLMEGYIVLHEEEILRVCRGDSFREQISPSKLFEFHRITFQEGGYAVFITYQHGEKPIAAENFFSPKRIQFTTDASNPDVLPQFLSRWKILWIERAGRPKKMR
jgi:hypothetical protein